MAVFELTITRATPFPCPECRGFGWGREVGTLCSRCDGYPDRDEDDLRALATLAHNLAIAGGLRAAESRGWRVGWKECAKDVGIGDDEDGAP